MRRQQRRTGALGVGLAVMVLVLAGCAGIPSSGRVESASDPDASAADAPRYAPAGPQAGATPEQIVRGFLDAMLAYPASTGTAARFLTPDARQTWKSQESTTVYTAQSLVFVTPPGGAEPATDDTVVELRATDQARLDAQGRYAATGRPFQRRLRLVRVDGQWRIADPPAGTLVTNKFFDDYYRPYSLWFFDRPGRRLVPEVVHLVAGERLATSLATSLAAGPADDEALRTYLRSGDGLRPSVPVDDDGVADVELADGVISRLTGDRDRIVAQLDRTLRQVPQVTSVRISAGTSRLTPDGAGGSGTTARFDPAGAAPRVYAVAQDRLREVSSQGLESVAGTWGKDAKGVSSVAVGDAGVAAVLDGGAGVRVTDRLGKDPFTVPSVGPSPLVTWDSAGLLWIVDRPAGRTRVRVVRGTQVRVVDAPDLADLDVSSFSISADGGHVALTDGTSGVRVGAIRRGASEDAVVGVLAPRRVVRSADRPAAARWLDGTHVAYLARTQVGVQVHTAAIDGSDRSGGLTGAEPLLPDVGAVDLAIGPGSEPPVWAVDRRGRLWYRPVGQSWLVASKGPVTSLSASP